MLPISFLLFLKFIQSSRCTAFNTSVSLVTCQDSQPAPYYRFFKCADSIAVRSIPLQWKDNMLKLGYKLTLSTKVVIFHRTHQDTSCQCLSDADFTLYLHCFHSIQFYWLCFPSTFIKSSLLHNKYFNSFIYFHWLFQCCSLRLLWLFSTSLAIMWLS